MNINKYHFFNHPILRLQPTMLNKLFQQNFKQDANISLQIVFRTLDKCWKNWFWSDVIYIWVFSLEKQVRSKNSIQHKNYLKLFQLKINSSTWTKHVKIYQRMLNSILMWFWKSNMKPNTHNKFPENTHNGMTKQCSRCKQLFQFKFVKKKNGTTGLEE